MLGYIWLEVGMALVLAGLCVGSELLLLLVWLPSWGFFQDAECKECYSIGLRPRGDVPSGDVPSGVAPSGV